MLKRILIVEDHPMYADALRVVLESSFAGASVECVQTLRAAKEQLTTGPNFGLVLLDLWLPDSAGLDGIIELRKYFSRPPIVIISAYGHRKLVRAAAICGAAGFIPKALGRDDLVKAIKSALAQQNTIEHSDRDRSPRTNDRPFNNLPLTQQQLRVLSMLRRGMHNKQIGHELSICETTVKAHVSEILRKLKVASRTQAVIELSCVDSGSGWWRSAGSNTNGTFSTTVVSQTQKGRGCDGPE